MTQEQAKEFSPLIQALADGKVIQYKPNPEIDEWVDIENPGFCFNIDDYRIKIEPQFRPFKNAQECWNEMLKHQPFGWVIGIPKRHLISSVGDGYIWFSDKVCCDFEEAFNTYNFADGASYGIKEV